MDKCARNKYGATLIPGEGELEGRNLDDGKNENRNKRGLVYLEVEVRKPNNRSKVYLRKWLFCMMEKLLS